MLLTTLAIVAGLSGSGLSGSGLSEVVAGKIQDYIPLLPLAWDGSLASPHIVGGKETVPHSHPHQVALYIKGITENGDRKSTGCGGSLLSESWVLTAAQCVDKRVIFKDMEGNSKKNKVIVTAVIGAHSLKELYAKSVQLINASEIIIHPQWTLLTIKNDIALLKLEKKVKLDGKYAKSIRLPKNSQLSESFTNSVATMTGWGITDSNNKPAVKLQTADSKVIGNLYCKIRYFFLLVRDTNICVSGSSANTCNGDSGGPLIVKEADGQPTLVGITSFGFGCAWGFPSVFTRITSYLMWILSTTSIESRT